MDSAVTSIFPLSLSAPDMMTVIEGAPFSFPCLGRLFPSWFCSDSVLYKEDPPSNARVKKVQSANKEEDDVPSSVWVLGSRNQIRVTTE